MKFFLFPLAVLLAAPAAAQNLDLGGPPGAAPQPVNISAAQGITWSQDSQTITATGGAKAVRGNVTVVADELVAHYRKKQGTAAPASTTPPAGGNAAAPAASELEQGGGELYELEAVGHVHIYTATDNAWGDRAVYSMDSQVLVLTGGALKLTTPQDTITAKESVEYYSGKHMAVARGDALIVTNDGRSIAADVITGYLSATPQAPATGTSPDMSNTGQLQKVEAVGHVVIKTQTDTTTGDSGVYLPPTQQARLGGNVHIIHGPNELAGADALVNMKTGVATLLAAPGGQVSGVIVPNSGGGASQ
ncbi:LptA/OstA family protein [Acidocella aromatica]|uniref:Lipopolysaccharide export system protein LptA n=1 Tax=Acidocella aromatica TaxID=1303579 RepID=A0A840VLL3_9PROT|nr:LptA/OstA family protein [Acidocella aromatica]MBB5372360.1 lipopolysaccharide export system protein LptA [Acidocella aromatica]